MSLNLPSLPCGWALLFTSVLLVILTGCPAGGGGGGGNTNDNSDDGGSNGGGVTEGDFVDNGGPAFEGADDVPQLLSGPVQGVGATVQLPDGVSLPLSQLRTVTAGGEAEVGADGMVTPTCPGIGLFLTPVVDDNDRIILFGYTSTAGVSRAINVDSTARALLYFALGGWTLPHDRRSDLLSELEHDYDDVVDVLSNAIADAMRDNPAAVGERDPNVVAAVETARQGVIAAAMTTAKMAKGKGSANEQGAGSADGFFGVSPSTTTAQSGVFLRTSSAGDSIHALNRFRRRAHLYAYVNGSEDASGVRTDVSPVRLADGPVELEAAGTPDDDEGLLSRVLSMASNYFPPTASDPLLLSGEPGAAETMFDMVVIGPTLDQTASSPLFTEPRFVLARDEWTAALEELEWETFVLDFFVPLFNELAFGTVLPPVHPTASATVTAIRGLVEPLLTAEAISLKTAQGFRDALRVSMREYLGNLAFRNDLLSAMGRSLGPANANFSYNGIGKNVIRQMQSAANDAAQSLSPDVGGLFDHLQRSRDAELWSVTLSRVRLSPAEPIVSRENPSVHLHVRAATLPDRTLCYAWRTPGVFGFLEETQGTQVADSFTSGESTIVYLATPSTIVLGDMDTVSVDVFDVTDTAGATSNCTDNAGLGTLIGSATVTIVGRDRTDQCTGFDLNPYNQDSPLTVDLSPTIVRPGDLVTVTVTYDFAHANADPNSGSETVTIFLPRACGYCGYPQCLCDQEDRSSLLYDYGLDDVYNVSDTPLVTGIGRNDDENVRGVRTDCAFFLEPIYSLPDREVREAISHTFTYVFNADFPPCPLDDPQCYCPRLAPDDVFLSEGLVWYGNFVIVRAEGGLAVKILDVAVDAGFERGVTNPCTD